MLDKTLLRLWNFCISQGYQVLTTLESLDTSFKVRGYCRTSLDALTLRFLQDDDYSPEWEFNSYIAKERYWRRVRERNNEVTVINDLSSRRRVHTLSCLTTHTELTAAVHLCYWCNADRQDYFVYQKASFCQMSALSFSQFNSSNP